MKKAISITIDVELFEKLKEKADAENRKLSNLIETILYEWLEDK